MVWVGWVFLAHRRLRTSSQGLLHLPKDTGKENPVRFPKIWDVAGWAELVGHLVGVALHRCLGSSPAWI